MQTAAGWDEAEWDQTDLLCTDCGEGRVQVTRIGWGRMMAVECPECGSRLLQDERQFPGYGEEGGD